MKLPNRTIVLWVSGFLASAAAAFAGVAVGQPFPHLRAYDVAGNLPPESERVVLVDFWATWCAPCRASFAAYNSLQRELGPRGLVIIGVSVDQDEDKYSDFVERFAPVFTTVRDSELKLVNAVQPPAMPTCYLIDRRGVLRSVHTGFHGASSTRELRAEIIKLLEEKP